MSEDATPPAPPPARRDLAPVRANMAADLPGYLARAVESYRALAAGLPSIDDSKRYAGHHAACRAALAHIDLLVRVHRWAAGVDKDGAAHEDDAADLLARARARLDAMAPGGDDDADDNERSAG